MRMKPRLTTSAFSRQRMAAGVWLAGSSTRRSRAGTASRLTRRCFSAEYLRTAPLDSNTSHVRWRGAATEPPTPALPLAPPPPPPAPAPPLLPTEPTDEPTAPGPCIGARAASPYTLVARSSKDHLLGVIRVVLPILPLPMRAMLPSKGNAYPLEERRCRGGAAAPAATPPPPAAPCAPPSRPPAAPSNVRPTEAAAIGVSILLSRATGVPCGGVVSWPASGAPPGTGTTGGFRAPTPAMPAPRRPAPRPAALRPLSARMERPSPRAPRL
mmetsp:Transcript_4291/g.17251  ORF Transcript_4291/g.17251 Transcript_4291/m.17251 type:complete len:270 (-) Transcript_4291:29-838(-)